MAMVVYCGDARHIVKRIVINHCSGNVEGSALRKHVAEAMGFKLRTEVRPSSSRRVRIVDPEDGENIVSGYIRSGSWKIVICEDYNEAHDFQWYAIEQLRPLLNKDVKDWDVNKRLRYETLFEKLLGFREMDCNTLRSYPKTGAGVYVLYHPVKPQDFLVRYRYHNGSD